MKLPRPLAAAFCAAALAACSGPQARIRKHQAEFDSYSPAIQEKIRAGRVDAGFTAEQVALALGRPDRVYPRKTLAAPEEVWAYGRGASEAGLGGNFGMGTGSGPGYYNGGIGSAAEPEPDRGERVRVVFQDGAVVAVERRGEP